MDTDTVAILECEPADVPVYYSLAVATSARNPTPDITATPISENAAADDCAVMIVCRYHNMTDSGEPSRIAHLEAGEIALLPDIAACHKPSPAS